MLQRLPFPTSSMVTAGLIEITTSFPIQVTEPFDPFDVIRQQALFVSLNGCRLQQNARTHRHARLVLGGRCGGCCCQIDDGLMLIMQSLYMQPQILHGLGNERIVVRGDQRGGRHGRTRCGVATARQFQQQIATIMTVI